MWIGLGWNRSGSLARSRPTSPRAGPTRSAADGSPSWRILDPVRNRFFEIGWLEFELLARWSEHDRVDELIAQVEAETPLRPTEDEVVGHLGDDLAEVRAQHVRAGGADERQAPADGREGVGIADRFVEPRAAADIGEQDGEGQCVVSHA